MAVDVVAVTAAAETDVVAADTGIDDTSFRMHNPFFSFFYNVHNFLLSSSGFAFGSGLIAECKGVVLVRGKIYTPLI
jgi:hypothetical protein